MATTVSASVSDEFAEKLDEYAEEHDRKKSEVIRGALREEFNEDKSEIDKRLSDDLLERTMDLGWYSVIYLTLALVSSLILGAASVFLPASYTTIPLQVSLYASAFLASVLASSIFMTGVLSVEVVAQTLNAGHEKIMSRVAGRQQDG